MFLSIQQADATVTVIVSDKFDSDERVSTEQATKNIVVCDKMHDFSDLMFTPQRCWYPGYCLFRLPIQLSKNIHLSTKPEFWRDWEAFCECPLSTKYGYGRWDV